MGASLLEVVAHRERFGKLLKHPPAVEEEVAAHLVLDLPK